MESAIIFRVKANQLSEIVALGLAMVDKTQLDPTEIELKEQVIKWNRADAIALISGRITDQQYIESNRMDQK